MAQQKLKFTFDLAQAGKGLMLTSPDMSDFHVWLDGKENKEGIIRLMSPALNLYLWVNYGIQSERCLVDLSGMNGSLSAGQKLGCIVTFK